MSGKRPEGDLPMTDGEQNLDAEREMSHIIVFTTSEQQALLILSRCKTACYDSPDHHPRSEPWDTENMMGRRWSLMQFRLKRSHDSNPQSLKRVERTSISFTEEDLVALARLVQAGQVILQDTERPPVVARIKAAMTRLGITIPYGL